jgi:hypothetical protein
MNLKRKKHLYNFTRPLTDSNHQSTIAEVQEVINSLNRKKSSGYDLITVKTLKELPVTGIKYLTQLFNTVLLKGYFISYRGALLNTLLHVIVYVFTQFAVLVQIANKMGFKKKIVSRADRIETPFTFHLL